MQKNSFTINANKTDNFIKKYLNQQKKNISNSSNEVWCFIGREENKILSYN